MFRLRAVTKAETLEPDTDNAGVGMRPKGDFSTVRAFFAQCFILFRRRINPIINFRREMIFGEQK